MAASKEIRTQITSVQNTHKITCAMQMVAASKMRQAHKRMECGKSYSQRIRTVIGHIASSHSEYHHRYMVDRPVKRLGCVIVSSDRGLCGGLNINLFKAALAYCQGEKLPSTEIDFCLLGAKAIDFFRSVGGKVVATHRDMGDNPSVSDLIGAINIMLTAFNDDTIDRLVIASNEFVSTMRQLPRIEQLLPLPKLPEDEADNYWDYIYEPDDARTLLGGLLTRYIESQVYQYVVENIACEQAARMIAMKNASDNALELIDQLKLVYNKERQALITQELSEIAAGTAAV